LGEAGNLAFLQPFGQLIKVKKNESVIKIFVLPGGRSMKEKCANEIFFRKCRAFFLNN
jgi:hypothetical protein